MYGSSDQVLYNTNVNRCVINIVTNYRTIDVLTSYSYTIDYNVFFIHV